ncbi:hypothetical protein LRS06_13095 [Hymenobacter sp. J193]|uniref:hypothetical protein n=1 Tax=Hymenobacter sp. J193 TaxID=2898429 RepID=UPI0021512836|nr:hypothetical protein [Hymenobacter sp. J193]MCR5888686.1 hypothetical protein [Hymenobacter sp. J193]
MQKNLTLTFAAALLTTVGFAQSIDPQKISFDYVRLPLVPLPAAVHTFRPEVVTRYEEAIKQQQANRVAAIADAQTKAAEAKKNIKPSLSAPKPSTSWCWMSVSLRTQ